MTTSAARPEHRAEERREPVAGASPAPLPRHRLSTEEAIEEAELAHAPDDAPAAARPLWRERAATVGAISGGGMLGANARYLAGKWAVDRWGGGFPWGTLAINLVGGFMLGLYLTLVTERLTGRATTRLFIATGLLGALTTFSTFSYETLTLLRDGRAAAALLYVGLSLAGGLGAAILGAALGRMA